MSTYWALAETLMPTATKKPTTMIQATPPTVVQKVESPAAFRPTM